MLVILLGLFGCSTGEKDDRFTLKTLEANWANGRLHVVTEQKLALSDEARDALIHGVPLTLELEVLLREASNKTRVGQNTSRFEIRYLPLSNHYQLAFAENDTVKTFPRLRHVLAELSRSTIDFSTGALPAGEYEILARIRLDQHGMPPPMRLPVLLSSNWHHDSSWSSWPLVLEPGA